MKRVFYLLVLLLLCNSLSLWAEQRNVIPDTLYIGTPFEIHLSVSSKYDSLAAIVPDSLKAFQIINQHIDRTKDANELIIKAAAFETGPQVFPDLVVMAISKESVDSLHTSSFHVLVRSVLPAKGKPVLKDIAPPMGIPWTIWNYILIALSIAVVVMVVLLIRTVLRHKKQKQTDTLTVEDMRAPWDIGLAELADLNARKLLDQGEFLEYHYSLSMILRGFLERFAGFHALEMTTYEIREHLDRIAFSRKNEIVQFLMTNDAVKFARQIPRREDSQSAAQFLETYLRSFAMQNAIRTNEDKHA